MIVQGTEKIRGCVVMSSPKLELKKNQTAHLSDDDFNKPELQAAISCGYVRVLEHKSSGVKKQAASDGEKIKCRNEFSRPIGMNFFPREIQPQEEFFLTSAQLDEAEVRSAIDKGYIQVVKDKKEATLNIQELAAKAQETAKTRNITLDTNEEITTPTEVVEPKKQIKEAVVFKPNEPPPAVKIPVKEQEQPRRNLKMSVIDTPNPEPVHAEDVPGRRVAAWNPANNPLPFQKTSATEDIGFVDQELEKQRRESHPILKDVPLQTEKEVQFVDHEQEEQRIQSHPILKNKPSDACDIDLV